MWVCGYQGRWMGWCTRHLCGWPNFFLELEFTLPRTLAGDAHLYQLVHQDEADEWVFGRPGFEDED